MALSKGDFVLVEYVVTVKDDNRVINTNIEEEARKAGIYEDGRRYEPELVIVGEGWLLKAVDEALTGFEVGEEKVLELPPEKAFGVRDPNKVRVIPAIELSRRGIIPRVNMEVEYGGRRGIIRSVGGGRVVLDFNHPLAGRTIVYRIKVLSRLDNVEDKVRELVHRWFMMIPRDSVKVKVENEAAKVVLPREALLVENSGLLKRGVARDIERYLPDISEVRFMEIIEIKRGEKEGAREAEEAKPVQESQAGGEGQA